MNHSFRLNLNKNYVDAFMFTLINLGLYEHSVDPYFGEKIHAFLEDAEVRWALAENNRLFRELIEVLKDG